MNFLRRFHRQLPVLITIVCIFLLIRGKRPVVAAAGAPLVGVVVVRLVALLALLAAWGVARLAWARLGGLNGDALGAMIALGEVVLLLAQALLGPAPSSMEVLWGTLICPSSRARGLLPPRFNWTGRSSPCGRWPREVLRKLCHPLPAGCIGSPAWCTSSAGVLSKSFYFLGIRQTWQSFPSL